MEKLRPAYALAGFQREFSSEAALRMTKSAQDSAWSLGLSRIEVVDIIQRTTPACFYKSMTTWGDSRIWQDVYRVPWNGLLLYLKFSVDDRGRYIVSLKEV